MRSVDILKRDGFVDKVSQFIECLSENWGNSTFAIEGGWGTGKTYVLEMLKERLNPVVSEETYNERYLIFDYNCWEYDYYEEPLAAILVPVVDMIQSEKAIFGKNVDATLKTIAANVKKELKKALGELSKEKIGLDFVKIWEQIAEGTQERQDQDWEFDQHVKFRKTLMSVKESIRILAKEKTVVFIVDELDRCLPMYAIKVLERLHHLFAGVENVAVILAIDSKQLTHSVHQIFGTDLDCVENYLRKFIDFSFVLDVGNVSVPFEEKYSGYFSKFKTMTGSDATEFQNMYEMIYSGLDIRTQEKLIEEASLLHSIICKDDQADSSLMLFEILWTGVTYLTGSTDLKWLVGCSSKYLMEGKGKISVKKLVEYQRIEETLGELEENTRNFRGSLLEKTFWLLATLYYDVSESICGEYKYEQSDNLTGEMEWAKRYAEIGESVRWCEKTDIILF